jgi:hypothetical protein
MESAEVLIWGVRYRVSGAVAWSCPLPILLLVKCKVLGAGKGDGDATKREHLTPDTSRLTPP